jgi:hypothetical protein
MLRRWVLLMMTVATFQAHAGNGVERDEWDSREQEATSPVPRCPPRIRAGPVDDWDSDQRVLLEQEAADCEANTSPGAILPNSTNQD